MEKETDNTNWNSLFFVFFCVCAKKAFILLGSPKSTDELTIQTLWVQNVDFVLDRDDSSF